MATVPPRCRTGKRIYWTRGEADRAVADLAEFCRRNGKRVPKRSYICGDCDGFHITAVPLDRYDPATEGD